MERDGTGSDDVSLSGRDGGWDRDKPMTGRRMGWGRPPILRDSTNRGRGWTRDGLHPERDPAGTGDELRPNSNGMDPP